MMSNDTTQHPADVRGRIIRASILPIEDEETMIARLRAGAEAVERGELDAEDFAGIWSQYLRELFRRTSSVPAPADLRERERAVRDEATGYLAEVADILADMHYGEECLFKGGEGCLACYAQDRIAEMQDALAARRGEGGE